MKEEIKKLQERKRKLLEAIEFTKQKKKEIINLMQSLVFQLSSKKITRQEYEEKLRKALKGRTSEQWIKYYNNYLDYYHYQIKLSDERVKQEKLSRIKQVAKEKAVPALKISIVLIVIALMFSLIFILKPVGTNVFTKIGNKVYTTINYVIENGRPAEFTLPTPIASEYVAPVVPVSLEDKNLPIVEESLMQYQAVVGKPVKWKKQFTIGGVSGFSVELPKGSEKITIKTIISGKEEDITSISSINKKRNLLIFGERAVEVSINTNSITGNVIVNNQEQVLYRVEYETPAPAKSEELVEGGKRILIRGPEDVHYKNILSFTELPKELNQNELGKFELYQIKNGNREIVKFTAYDTNENGLYNYIEWIIPELSETEFLWIIKTTKAEHLDGNKDFISDIYPQIQALDGNWSETVNNDEYVRVTFEQNLTNKNDITIYARATDEENAEIEVYKQGDSNLITKFENISNENWYKVYLINLSEGESYNVFDLKILGSAEFDYIVDPFFDNSSLKQILYDCGNLNTTNAVYTLNQSLINKAGSCLVVKANNITINLNGYAVDGDDSGSDQGVRSAYNYTTIKNGTITDFRHGIYLESNSNNSVSNIITDSNTYGILLSFSLNNVFRDSSFANSVSNDVWLMYSSNNNTFLNVSYNLNKESVQGGYLIRNWYYQANVSYQGMPVSGADLSVYNNSYPAGWQFNLTSNSAGLTNIIEIIDYVSSSGTIRNYYSNYTINVVNGILNESHNLNVTEKSLQSGFGGLIFDEINFLGDTISPFINFTSPTPANGSTWNYSWLPVNVSAYDDITYNNNISTFIDFDNSLIGWWRMDDYNDSTKTVYDYTGRNNGTVYGNATQTDGKLGKGMKFDGFNVSSNDNDFINCKNDSSLNLKTGSWGAWVKLNSKMLGNIGERIIFKESTGSPGSNGIYELFYWKDKNRFRSEAVVSGVRYITESSSSVNLGEWYYLVSTYDGEILKLYVNGVNVGNNETPSGNIDSSLGPLIIGSSLGQPDMAPFNGTIDDVMIFNRSLSAEEISALYANTSSKYLFNNFTDLAFGNHTFKAYVQDTFGNVNWTEKRSLAISTINVSISYPVQFAIFQRHNSITGEIPIYGTYSGTPASIEASFNGGSYVTINSSPSGGIFSGKLNASLGQGKLIIRFSNNPSINSSVSNIGIGDVFVIGGQSNAEGCGSYQSTLNSSDNFNATVYREDGAWKLANDPTDSDPCLGNGSVWPKIADYIIQNQSIPVAFITVADGGTSILQWQKGQTQYENMINQVRKATNGTMRVKTLLFFQGETDAKTDTGVRGNYNYYKSNLTKMANDFINDTEIATTVIAGQIDRSYSSWTRTTVDNIRKAQQDLWNEDNNISAGPVTYDITQTDVMVVHFNTNDEITAFANRWWASVANVIYGVGDGRGPILKNITFGGGNNNLILSFDESSLPLLIKNWNGTISLKAQGFRIVDGSVVLDDNNITSAVVINNNQIQINFSTNISLNAKVSLGSYTDGYNKNIIRDNSSFSLPAEAFLDFPLLDTFLPSINFTSPTPANGSTWNYSWLPVNVSASDVGRGDNNISTFIDFDNSLVGWWRMDDYNDSTKTVYDYTGRNNGTVYGNATQTDGKLGKGMKFDGNSSYINTTMINFPSGNASRTVSLWLKWYPDSSVYDVLFGYGSSSSGLELFGAFMEPSGNLRFWCNYMNVSDNYYTGINIPVGNWIYLTFTYNGTDIKIYRNGVLQNTKTKLLNTVLVKSAIGINSFVALHPFNGTIDDVMIFNRSLSAEEISALYANTSSKYLFNNFTDLAFGNHTFKAYVQDTFGNVNWTEKRNVFVNVSITALRIIWVQNLSNVTGNPGDLRNVSINFSVYDAGGFDDLNDSSARANFTRNNFVRNSASCSRIAGESYGSYANYTCYVEMWYYDQGGMWDVSVSIADKSGTWAVNTSSFLYEFLYSFNMTPDYVNWSDIQIGDVDEPADNNMTISNLGNANIINISINASRLNGTGSYPADFIPAANFSFSNLSYNSCNLGAGAISLIEDQNVSFRLFINYSDSFNYAYANNSIGFCLKGLPAGIHAQEYKTGDEKKWEINAVFEFFISMKYALLVAAIVVKNKRKKKNKLSEAELLKLNSKLKEKYNISISEILKEIEEEKAKKEIQIPILIFESRLGPAEALCKYLKESLELKYSEIAELIDRDERTVWINYRNASRKIKGKIKTDPKILMPINIFSDRRLSILESVVRYLKEKQLRNVEIAKLLGKDQRNIYTLYSRARKKLSI
ncbi:MAG: sialate O-acetylesterase [Candidatus Nanoarchaeia archaeon]|nr:sialate O-acetylesterase [Candidatus Nanoarchaeia archaeon]MDD5741121.1 sialate O-acetylesterase [Candidatus Nanoarchaeia archaeon]